MVKQSHVVFLPNDLFTKELFNGVLDHAVNKIKESV